MAKPQNFDLIKRVLKLENKTEDTGWIDLELKEGIVPYDKSEIYKCRYRKIGEEVTVIGCVKGITKNDTVIATLPERI